MSSVAPERRPLVARLNPVSGAVALAVGSITVNGVALAADDNAFSGFYEDIVVTATRRSADVQDVPYNIAAFTGETLDEQRIDNLDDFARWVPGLTLTDQGSRDSDLLTVRGLNTSNIDAPEIFLGNSGGETVATYVGEIPLYVDLKLYDIDRVEVLIGPQGTLYGSGTLAGAVRYIPKRPQLDAMTLDINAQSYVMDESDDLGYSADAVLNIPLVADRLALRALVGYDEVPGFIDYDFVVGTDQAGTVNPEDPSALRQIEDANDAQTTAVRASLLWAAADNLDAILTYHYQKVEAGGRTANSQAALGTSEYVYGRRFLEPKERENQLTSLEINWDLGFANLTSATGFSDYEDKEQRDQTDLLLDLGFGYETFPNFAAYTADAADEETFTQELRLVSDYGDSRFNWILGGFYRDYDGEQQADEFTPGYPGSVAYQNNVVAFGGIPANQLTDGALEYRALTKNSIEEIAVFGEVGYRILDPWQITLGARWFEYEDDFKLSVRFPFFQPEQPPFPEAAPVKEDDVIFKFNTSYDLESVGPMDSATAYFTVSEGYRNGRSNGLDDCDPSAVQTVCATPDEQRVDADTTTNYELGWKSNWLDNRMLFNAALFFIQWDDIRVTTVTQTGLQPIETNGSEAETQGIEMQGRWQITDELAVFGSYAYTNAELSKDAPGLIGGRFGAVDGEKGDRLSGTPEHQGALLFSYIRPLGGNLTLGVDYGFTTISDVLTKVGGKNGGESLGGFTVHNASVSLSGDIWTATLFADNLTNKFAVTGVRRDRDYIDTAGLFTLRGYYQNVIQPRTIGLDVRFNFDF